MQFHSYSAKLQLPPRGSLYFRVKTKQYQWENLNIQMTSYDEVIDHSKKKKIPFNRWTWNITHAKMQSVGKIRILHWCELLIFPEISLAVVIWTVIIISVLNTWARLGLRRKSNLSDFIESSVVWSLLSSVTLCRSKCEWARYYTTKKCPQRVCVCVSEVKKMHKV